MNLSFLRKKNLLNPQQQGDESDGQENDGQDTENDNDEDDTDTQDDSDAAASDTGDNTEEQLPVNTEEQLPVAAQPLQPQASNRFQQIFGQAVNQPQGPMSQRYANYLNQPIPSKEQYKPSKMNRLGAVLGGASEAYFRGPAAGMKLKESILDRPYEEAMGRYALTGKQLEKGAEVESKNLGRAASFARTATNADIAQSKNEVDRLKAEAQARHWNASDANTATNAAQKGWVHSVGTDGHLVFHRVAQDGSVQTLDGGKVGESIPEKTKRVLDERQKESDITQKRQLTVGKSNAEARSAADETRAANRQIEDNKKAAIQQQLIKDRAAATKDVQANKPATAQQNFGQHQNRMQTFLDKNPSYSKFFHIDPATGRPLSLYRPDDTDDATWNSIIAEIYPKSK